MSLSGGSRICAERARVRLLAGLLLTALTVAVAAARTPTTERAPAPTAQTHELLSNDGTYLLRYRTDPAQIELGVDFDVECEVLLASSGEPVPDATLRIDGDMPEHGHGLLRLPPTEAAGAARFRAEDLRFFMPGQWELYFDITRGALTERAQLGVEID